MIYVVTGMMRSGTSMVMRALKAGGMGLYYSLTHEAELRAKYPKERNPGGYWEPSPSEREQLHFPLKAEGMAVKIMAPWLNLGIMPPAEYRILVVRRDPHEIGASIEKLMKRPLSRGDQHVLANYDAHIDKAVSVAWNRRDVTSVVTLDYNEILAHPMHSFKRLVKFSWPIIPTKAARTIKPKLRTCRRVPKTDRLEEPCSIEENSSP